MTITLADIQRHLGVAPDGKWGPVTLVAVAKALGIDERGRKLSSPDRFFAAVRQITGPLNQTQVDTINRLLETASHWPTGWLAYGLATAWHEARFEPQPEWGRGKGKAYGKPGRYGQPQYGRGLVQLTWDDNYEWADEALGLDGALLANFDLALDPKIAADILVRGMEQGAFAGDDKGRHSLARHLPGEYGTAQQFVQARRIINGTDKALQIAGLAGDFQGALSQGGWG
jgi:putative chitinase